MDPSFNFDCWIVKYNLTPIRSIFIEYGMNTSQSIHFGDAFSKLISDRRVVAKPDIIPQIMEGMHDHVESQKHHSVLLVSDAEKNALLQIKKYIKNMEYFKSTLNEMMAQYLLKKTENTQRIQKYIELCDKDLIQKHKDITHIFTDLCNSLEQKEDSLLKTIHAFRIKFNQYHTDHQQVTNGLDKTLQETESIIQDDLKHIKEQEIYCKDILKDFNKHFSSRSKLPTQKRETKIVKIANYSRECYLDAMQTLRKTESKIMNFVQNNIQFDIDITDKTKDIYCVKQSSEIMEQLKNHATASIDIVCAHEDIGSDNDEIEKPKQTQHKPKKKNQKNKNNRTLLKKQIQSVKHKLKAANQTITRLQKSSETERNKLQHEMKELERKLDAMKTKPEIQGIATQSTVQYIDTFDRLYVDKSQWLLSKSRRKVRGTGQGSTTGCCNDRSCMFLQFDSSKVKGGTYSCSIKWINSQCDGHWMKSAVEAPCSIGITTKRNANIVKQAVQCTTEWPDWASNSYFSAQHDFPHWYVNEVITIKLDLDDHVVHYYKDNELMKTDKLPINVPFYVMMCSSSFINGACCFAYAIVNPSH
eukprot:259820_1